MVLVFFQRTVKRAISSSSGSKAEVTSTQCSEAGIVLLLLNERLHELDQTCWYKYKERGAPSAANVRQQVKIRKSQGQLITVCHRCLGVQRRSSATAEIARDAA